MSIPLLSSRTLDPSEAVEPVCWIVPGFAARGYLTILAGVAGVGKSTLALQMSAEVGQREGSPALYLDIENGPSHLRRLSQAMSLPAGAVDLVDMHGLRLSDPETREQLTREVLGRGIAGLALHRTLGSPLVVLDSLRRFAPGLSENSSDDMAPYIASLTSFARATNSAVVLIHHSSGKQEAPAMRGSSAIEDQVDMAFALTRRGNTFKLAVIGDKFRVAAKPNPVLYHRELAPLRYQEGEGAETQTVTGSLVDLLHNLAFDSHRSLAEIGLMLGMDTSNDTESKRLRRALGVLVDSGEWEKSAKGFYRPLA